MKKIAVILTLAVAFCFALAQSTRSEKPTKEVRLRTSPIWEITQDGTDVSVDWQDHAPNPRFAVYDTDGDSTEDPATWVDDVVLDKETGLVWERSPSTTTRDWYSAIYTAYDKYLGGRKGWRLPTIEELASLVDRNEGPPTLPSGHPFAVQSSDYWSSTTAAADTSYKWLVPFTTGIVRGYTKSTTIYVWCVRGGPGYDAY